MRARNHTRARACTRARPQARKHSCTRASESIDGSSPRLIFCLFLLCFGRCHSDLRDNFLNGTLPDSLGALLQLRYLYATPLRYVSFRSLSPRCAQAYNKWLSADDS